MRQGPAGQPGTLTYLHGDHLGSTSLTTDANGAKTARVLYYPYGEERYREGTLQTDYQFTSQRKEDFGLYDYRARFYDPLLGRFVSADTIVPNFLDPQLLNRYCYARNNPVLYNDPDGHCGPLCIATLIALGLVVATIPGSTAENPVGNAIPPYQYGLHEVRKHTDFIRTTADEWELHPIILASAIADQGNTVQHPFGWYGAEKLLLEVKPNASVGLAQIRPSEQSAYREKYGLEEDLFDPEASIQYMAAKLQTEKETIAAWERIEGTGLIDRDRFMLLLIAQNGSVFNSFVGEYQQNWQALLIDNAGAWRVLNFQISYIEYLLTQGWSLPPGIETEDLDYIKRTLESTMSSD
jgi:RHS repeat-associated protein